MPAGGIITKQREEILSFDELVSLAEIFADLGIRKIRVTGGEPLVRRGIESLCAGLASIPGIETLALSTNGVMLEELAAGLRRAGVSQVNVSLDTLRPERFAHVTQRTSHGEVLDGIRTSLDAGFDSVKINTVVMRGFNDDEILDFVEFAAEESLNVRFIEYMPFAGNGWSEARLMSYAEMRGVIESRFGLMPLEGDEPVHGPSRDFRVAGTQATVGFITTMTEHFCSSCNRLRLTADGRMLNCLFDGEGINLRRLLRNGAERSVIEDSIRASVLLKWERHPDAEDLQNNHMRTMFGIGG